MTDSLSEQLLGYAIGALDDAERAAVDEALARDPDLRRQLADIQSHLQPLSCLREAIEPPLGLAERTCRRVAALAARRGAAGRRGRLSDEPAAGQSGGSVRWPDVAVGIGLCVGLMLLVLPAVQGSRFASRIRSCQDNLRQVGLALGNYSHAHADFFPGVPAAGKTGVAGIYAPTLVEGGFLAENRALLCPAAQLPPDGFHVPSLSEVETAPVERLANLQCSMGGSYGYCLGYVQDGVYHDTKNLHRPFFALAADVPSDEPGHQSRNHDGRGQNVLFEDGRVAFLPITKIAGRDDDIYVNDSGLVAPGMHADDAVVAASATAPFCAAGPQR